MPPCGPSSGFPPIQPHAFDRNFRTSYNRRMAVVRSGGETIVRHSRALVATYYVLAAAAGVISGLSPMVAPGMAVETGTWKERLWSVISRILGALWFAVITAQLYGAARAYARALVAIGIERLRVHLGIGPERRFEWREISGITYEHNRRERVCRFTAGDSIYTLTQDSCPSPGIVAQLPAEKKGILLAASGASA